MWKYLGYIPLVIALLGSIYGGLRIASELQTTLDDAIQMGQDSHERLDGIISKLDFVEDEIERKQKDALERVGMTLDNNKMLQESKVENLQRELLELQRVITMLEGTTQSLEKKSFDTVSMTQMDGLREQIFQVKDSVMQLQNPIDSGMNYQQMIFDVQNQIQELERRVNEEHKGNWN
jgi:hypothetical protein|tara:strand:+ start:283 stop:816 length:534 start_codon:yes stop_codon:yes gene_type:complete